jgi:uncharacterized protein
MNDNNGAALVTRILLHPGIENAFADWHAEMWTAPGNSPGFIGTEIKAPAIQGDREWSVIHHFRSASEMQDWQNSEAHRRLLEKLGAIAGGDRLREMESADLDSDSTVTEVITAVVKRGSESAYREWASRIHALEARFPGYRGGLFQPPVSDKLPCWTTLVRFATPQQLDTWLDSDERKKLVAEQEDLVHSWSMHRLPTSFAGWFPAEDADREPSTTLKQSMAVLLMLFPIVMLEMRLLNPYLTGIPSAVAIFIGNVLSVALIGWVFMPIAIVFLDWWLSPKKGTGPLPRAAGYGLLGLLYAAEIAALWNLL